MYNWLTVRFVNSLFCCTAYGGSIISSGGAPSGQSVLALSGTPFLAHLPALHMLEFFGEKMHVIITTAYIFNKCHYWLVR